MIVTVPVATLIGVGVLVVLAFLWLYEVLDYRAQEAWFDLEDAMTLAEQAFTDADIAEREALEAGVALGEAMQYIEVIEELYFQEAVTFDLDGEEYIYYGTPENCCLFLDALEQGAAEIKPITEAAAK